MNRSKFLVKLAIENKFAIVDDKVSVISIDETLREAGMEIDVQDNKQDSSYSSQEDNSKIFVNQEVDDKVSIKNVQINGNLENITCTNKPYDLNVHPNIDMTHHTDDIQTSTSEDIRPFAKITSQNFGCSDLEQKINPHTRCNPAPVDQNFGVDERTLDWESRAKIQEFAESTTERYSSNRDTNKPNDTNIKIISQYIFKRNSEEYDNFSDFESSGSEYIPSEYDSDSSEVLPENNEAGEVQETDLRKENEKNYATEQQAIMRPDTADSIIYQPSTSFKTANVQSQKRRSETKIEEPSSKKAKQYSPLPDPAKNHNYIKNPSARERPTICPFCFQDVVTHFPRHLFRHHKSEKQVKEIHELRPKSKDRLAMIAAIRKQGYFILKNKNNITLPVKTSSKPDTDYAVCSYCRGLYSRPLLYKHVKRCQSKPMGINQPGKNCLSKSQTFLVSMTSKNHELLRMLRIKEEVFVNMRADEIRLIAKNDPLICLYGEVLLAKHKRQQIVTLVSSKIREMARMLVILKLLNPEVKGLFDTMKPEMYSLLVTATKNISGYDPDQKTFKAPSLALHMGTNLKIVCNVAYKLVLENRRIPTIFWDDTDQKRRDKKDLKQLIESHWCSDLSSLALKTLKERKWEKPILLPIASDILAFQNYVNNHAEKAYENIINNINITTQYKVLTECILAHTVMFNRKRVGDVQYLTISTYERTNHGTEQKEVTERLLLSRKS